MVIRFPLLMVNGRNLNEMHTYTEHNLRLYKLHDLPKINTPKIIYKKRITKKPSREPEEQTQPNTIQF